MYERKGMFLIPQLSSCGGIVGRGGRFRGRRRFSILFLKFSVGSKIRCKSALPLGFLHETQVKSMKKVLAGHL